ncbi:hypothetical protein [Paraburkholderia phenazinium]|jgi:hypothetical protein|uniref:Uncharacterized protein n=1 Tax=Paraburkholderia phenazinium TaxID=60549 RepID=A0A1G7UV66_9BURK|nr:hypothetical protein [Paraburkholderia phenazinium]SDG51019.1 hypothetical protein SAMN05216466_103602 [Paraburkholderia phenazinium]
MKWFKILQQGHIEVSGVTYNLAHLLASSFTLAIPASSRYPAAVATLQVEYTSHCVSFGPENEHTPLDFKVLDGDRRILDHREIARAFCFDRHR